MIEHKTTIIITKEVRGNLKYLRIEGCETHQDKIVFLIDYYLKSR